MPKLKSLDPIQTEPFKVKVKKVKYFEFESTNKFAPEKSWIANCNCLIIKAGSEKKNKSYCNVQMYLSETEYNDKIIDVGDIILLTDKITWEVKKGISYKTYSSEKIKENKATNIKRDTNGKPYTEDFIYPYVIKAKSGTWSIYEKYDEYFIANIGNSRKIKLIFDSKSELENFSESEFYIDNDELDKIKNDNGGIVSFVGYAHKQKLCGFNVGIDLEFQPDIEKWLLKIKKIKNEKGDIENGEQKEN